MELVVILLVILLVAGIGPWWPHSRAWGYGPVGILILLFVAVLLFRTIGVI